MVIKFFKTNMNKALLLENILFNDNMNDIDFLVNHALKDAPINTQLDILTKAANAAEKFHSFFHFEQSYFHTQLSRLLHMSGNVEKAIEQLNCALFQDHLNMEAKELLSGTCSSNKYKRPFETFIEYANFATNEKIKKSDPPGYWSLDTTSLEKVIHEVKTHHLLYHHEAAKIYCNRALVFKELGNEMLSKNDVVKAENLDYTVVKLFYETM